MQPIRHFINLCEALQKLEILLEDPAFDIVKFANKVRGVQELILRGATAEERDAAVNAMGRLMARAKQEMMNWTAEARLAGERRIEAARLSAGKTNGQGNPKGKPAGNPGARPPPPPRPPPVTPYALGAWVKVAMQPSVVKIIHRSKKVTSFGRWPVDPDWTWEYIVRRGDGRTFTCRHAQIERLARQDEIDAAGAERTKPAGSGSAGSTSGSAGTSSGEWRITHLGHYEVHNTQENSNKIYGIAQKGERVITFWGGFTKKIATKAFNSFREANGVFQKKVRKGYQIVDERRADYAYLRKLLANVP